MRVHFSKTQALSLITLVFSIALLAMGCEGPAANTTVQTGVNATPQPTAAAIPAADAPSAEVTFTLPMLGALLADEDFVTAAKQKLPLTDPELQQLRDAAQKSVSELSDDDQNASHSSRAANEDARTKIEAIIGRERTDKLIALAQQEAGDVTAKAPTKPNSVPTDTRIVVNAPAYRMDVFKDGKLIKTYKVGIGYPEFPLPTGMRKATTIIFNPTWTPPDEPWVKGKVQAGKKIEAGDKLNPLGPIKIPIGLPSLIHGGKNPARLGTFASHGCVGLTNGQVQDFAMVLSSMAGDPISLEDIKGYEKAKTETKQVKLDQAVPVELRYETIVVEDGTLKIFRDVYEKGTNTEDDLRKVLEVYGVDLNSIEPAVRQKIMDALDQMATDAHGDPAEPSSAPKGNSNNSGKVTRDVKGKKEIDIPVPQLAGKGYPAPVALSSQ